jgi:hypothetical protein
MISLFAVVAPPRSGTKWYARLFNDGDVHCYHELTTLLQTWPPRAAHAAAFRKETSSHELELRERRFFLDAYPQYFRRLLEHGDRGIRAAGNSDNSLVDHGPGLWLIWPETRFLFSVRNGINQVNSAFVNEQRLPDIVHAGRPESLRRRTSFEAACARWASSIERLLERRAWLEEHGAACLSTTLERVTGDVAELERVWRWLVGDWERHEARALSLMRRPANEWVNVNGAIHTPEDVWEHWSPDQRETFVELCAAAQANAGYALPG